MAATTRTETITADDGGTFAGHLVLPEAGQGPGMLLLQEIFGVNDYIRGRAADLAALGYVVLCPDVFWRLEPGIELAHDEEGLGKAFGYVTRFDFAQGAADLGAALRHLRALPEVQAAGGKAGAMGFCLGGRLTYVVATHFDPDACVSYYGSGIHEALGDADKITCPILFEYGNRDDFIPNDQIDQVAKWVEGHDGAEIHIHDAGHAFDNPSGMFHTTEASEAAWEETKEFLARNLPVA